jgi:hypothetical protein
LSSVNSWYSSYCTPRELYHRHMKKKKTPPPPHLP